MKNIAVLVTPGLADCTVYTDKMECRQYYGCQWNANTCEAD